MDLKKISLIKKVLACQEIKIVTTDCESNTQLIPFFNFPNSDELLLKFSKYPSIPQLKTYQNSKNNVVFDFNPNNQVLLQIYKNSYWNDDIEVSSLTYQLQVLYSKYCLFSFAKIFIDEDPVLKSLIFIQLIQAFTKLKKIKNKNIQSLINEAFSYLFSEFLHSFDKKSFESIFSSLSDFLFSESHDIAIFSLIPDILHTLIREYGFNFDSITAKFASLIQMILVDKLTNTNTNKNESISINRTENNNEKNEEISEETMVVQKIFNCCQPFFLKLSDCALNLLCYLPKFLDENKIDAFFFQFPFCFEQFLESEKKPFILIPPKNDEIYQFTPIQSPSSLSQFYDINTFSNEFSLLEFNNNPNQEKFHFFNSDKYNNQFQFQLILNEDLDSSNLSSKLLPFMSTELISKIITVLKILDDNKEKYSLKYTFLNSFYELIKIRKDSSNVLDYITLFIHILTKLPEDENTVVPFPTSILFNPSYVVTQELHLLRLCSIGALLNFNLKTLEQLLRDMMKYPLIMTEICLIFIELEDSLSQILLNSSKTKFFRIFKEIGSIYQYEDVHGTTDKDLIETPRMILLSLFSKEFQYQDFPKIVMKDTIMLHFFLSHLFEPNLQSFLLTQLSYYIRQYDVSTEFVQMLNQLFLQIAQLMPNPQGVNLVSHLISVIVKNSKNLKLFVLLNDILSNIIYKLGIKSDNELTLTWKFIDEVFTLLISYSMSNIKIPQILFNSIEKVLIQIVKLPEETLTFIEKPSDKRTLDIKIFGKLIQLLSGTFISKYELIFDTNIVNFEVLKILFNIFHDSAVVNIFNFCFKFCCFSNLNCIECHSCGFDTLLLEYIQNNREKFRLTETVEKLEKIHKSVFIRPNSDSNLNESELISSNIYLALMTVFEIMAISSSPSIVQQVISLFTPVNNRYITPLHSVLVKKIEGMLVNEKSSPNVTISLIKSYSFDLAMESNFIFMCWIYIDSSTEATILNLKCSNEADQRFLSIAVGKQLIYINKACTFVQIPKNRWSFLTVSFTCNDTNGESNFTIELGLESIPVKKVENLHFDNEVAKLLASKNENPQKQNARHSNCINFSAVIGGNGSNSGRIGNFAFLPHIEAKTINSIFINGPRSNDYLKTNFDPFYYADDNALRKLNLSSIHYLSEEKTFSSILLNSFEIETFLPLFAQLDFPLNTSDQVTSLTFKATDLASLLKAAFSASSLQRNQDFDFSVLAHILINSDKKHLTCDLYKVFHSIYVDHLISLNNSVNAPENGQQFLKCLMNKVLANFEIWFAAKAEEHEKIIDFIKEQRIITFLPQILIILRMYYWYEPLPKLSSSSSSFCGFISSGISKHFVEHGLPDSERQRDPELNIKKCRRTLLSIFLADPNHDPTKGSASLNVNSYLDEIDIAHNNYSMNHINLNNNVLSEDEFLLLIGHSILIITTTRDPYQVYDILDFLQQAKYSFISIEKLFTIHKLLLNELSDDTVICLAIGVIISIHKQIHYNDNNFNLSKHIEIVFSIVSRRPISGNSSSFLESLIGMLNECPDLFELCSFLSMQRKESILYHRIKPSPFYCSRKTWPLWAVINSMNIISEKNRENELESSFILSFLIRCHPCEDCWFNIFDSIQIASLVFIDFHYFENRTRFLTLLGNYVLKNSTSLSDSCIEAAFMMIAFSILFRKHVKSHPISNYMKKLFSESPFYDSKKDFFENEEKKHQINFDNFAYPSEMSEVLRTQSSTGIKLDFTFGLKIDDRYHWLDSNLAELALSISIRFKGSKFYKASILIASFLLSSSYGIRSEYGYHKFIQWWFDEMNFSMKDKETNIDFFNFFYGKFNSTHSLIPEWQNLSTIIDWDLVLRHTIDFVELFNKQFYESQVSSPMIIPSSISPIDISVFNIDEFCLKIDRIIHKIVDSVSLLREDGMKKWETLWSSMTLIGGAWNFSCRHKNTSNGNEDEPLDTLDSIAMMSSSNINISDSRPKWKREFVATSFYCPMKLKKNKRFNPHIEAAITREIGNYSNAKQLVRAYRGKIEDQYRQQSQKTLLSLSDEFEQALNRSTSAKTVLKSKNDNNENVKRSYSLSKMEDRNKEREKDSENDISNSNSEVDDLNASFQSSASSSVVSTNSLFRQQQKKKKQDKNSYIIKCEYIKATKDVLGIFSISKKDLLVLISPPSPLLISSNFVSQTSTTEKVAATKTYRIPMRRITEIFMRKRFQHSTAIEIFCIDGESYFINFADKETAIKAVDSISKCIKNNILIPNTSKLSENLEVHLVLKTSLIANGNFLKTVQRNFNYSDFFEQQPFTSRWVEGSMSNFEYLIKLNIFSGRSFTDLSLYPIFPWIISKFDCKVLNLNDNQLFRDLSKPIGAIGEARLNALIERMEEMVYANQQMKLVMRKKKLKQSKSKGNISANSSTEITPPIGSSLMNLDDGFEDPYLYFSYVICPLAVFLYLIRMEPFTTLHIRMQSNKFDHGSRIFSSIADSFNSATTSLNNYRELPPDFFFSPEVLVNENGFDLGSNKHGVIDDVELPHWVRSNDSFEFVYLMRKALESDYVSSFLPDWIDLMWGYKQKGEEAAKANNIYSSQLYDTVWETHSSTLNNPGKKAEIEATLCHVGQIPPQLFKEKHARRDPKVPAPLFSSVSLVNFSQAGENLLNEKVVSAFISFEKDNVIRLSICSTFEGQSSDTSAKTRKKNVKVVKTRKIDFLINDDKSVRILKESNYFVKNLSPNSAFVKSFADDSCFLLFSGKLLHPFEVNIQEKVSSVAFNDGYMAAVVDNDSTVLLYGPEIIDQSSLNDGMGSMASSGQSRESFSSLMNFVGKPIKFYGEKVVCCDLLASFKVVVCGTSTGHVFICSLFNSVKTNVISLNDDFSEGKNSGIFVPRKILVSKAWGFIICYAESVPRSGLNAAIDRRNIEAGMVENYSPFNLDDEGDDFDLDSGGYDRQKELIGSVNFSTRRSIFVFNINGRFLRKVDIGFRLSSWCTWMSRKSFDYVAIGTDDGRLLSLEAYSLNDKNFVDNESNSSKWTKNGSFICLFSDHERSEIVACSEEKGTVVGVTADCKLVFAPIPSDFA